MSMHASSRIKRSFPTEIRIESKRRRVRKGTRSCWECKRRKVRCHFAAITDPTCDGCKRRKTTCISQEFPDYSAKVSSDSQVYDRLARLEIAVNSLVRKIGHEDGSVFLAPNERNLPGETRSSSHSIHGTSADKAMPAVFNDQVANFVDFDGRDADLYHIGESPANPKEPSTALLVNTDVAQEPDLSHTVGYDSLSHMLIQIWPSPRDFEIIVNLPAELSGLFHGIMCAPFSTIVSEEIPSARNMMQLSPTRCHPILIARKLLILATYLQSLSPTCIRILDDKHVNHRALMSSAVAVAHSCVTCNDDLLGSIEGIECIMIESMYQNNAGNLRSAWHCVRRAMLIAEMMGLHRGIIPQSPKLLDTQTRTRVHPEHMWFRLIQMNRYLSLMLGLLQGTPSNSFADCHLLQGCTPTERMQRLDCAVAGYILQRNEAGLFAPATTQMINQLLQESAASLPPTWWLVPDLEASAGNQVETLRRIIRTMDQLTHYHLITQLHLPHLMRSPEDDEYDHSKITIINASREVLARFTSLHDVHCFTSFCRGINFLAFIACTTICIIHIDAKSQRQACAHKSCASLGLLANQYQQDRDIMELTLKSMQRTARDSKDLIASKTAIILSHLLSMEADAALCEKHMANAATETERGLGCGGKVSDCGQILQIHIPYCGTIRFERGNTSGSDVMGGPSFLHRRSNISMSTRCFPISLNFTAPSRMPR